MVAAVTMKTRILLLLFVGVLAQCTLYASADDSDLVDEEYAREHPEEMSGYIEGDIMLDEDEEEEEGTFRNAIRNRKQLWPNATVFYQFDEEGNFSNGHRALLRKVAAHFKQRSCIRLIEKPKHTKYRPYVRIFRGKGCSSVVGYHPKFKKQRPQKLSLGKGCVGFGIVIHEMMHTLGFVHEQSRPDRDDYITVHPENMIKGAEANFNKKSPKGIQTLGEPYDYQSIMHYGAKAFSRNRKNTMTPKIKGKKLGQRRGLSKIDIAKLNKLYKCKKA